MRLDAIGPMGMVLLMVPVVWMVMVMAVVFRMMAPTTASKACVL